VGDMDRKIGTMMGGGPAKSVAKINKDIIYIII
jgi:hypothetical protein